MDGRVIWAAVCLAVHADGRRYRSEGVLTIPSGDAALVPEVLEEVIDQRVFSCSALIRAQV